MRYAPEAPEIEAHLPEAAKLFVSRFDHYEYPDLEAIEANNP